MKKICLLNNNTYCYIVVMICPGVRDAAWPTGAAAWGGDQRAHAIQTHAWRQGHTKQGAVLLPNPSDLCQGAVSVAKYLFVQLSNGNSVE